MRKFKKIDYTEYKNKYDESVKQKLHTSPDDIAVESMRAYIYGYTFTEKYAKGILPDELSMDYWAYESDDVADDVEEEFNLQSLEDFEKEVMDSVTNGTIDMYDVSTVQERRILEAIDSTGDGKTPETALCVIDVGQEYEYLNRVFPYSELRLLRQSVCNGIDCLEFEPAYGVERIYFDIKRRFELGYPGIDEHLNINDDDNNS